MFSISPFTSIAETRRLLRSKELSPVELIESLEQRIATIDPKIGAYIERDVETAKKEASSADLTKPLGGIPIGIKDAISVAGQPLQSASRILDGYTAPYDATAVARLRAAGAVPFGRLNMDEFAMGSSTENSAFQPTRNPWDTGRIRGDRAADPRPPWPRARRLRPSARTPADRSASPPPSADVSASSRPTDASPATD